MLVFVEIFLPFGLLALAFAAMIFLSRGNQMRRAVAFVALLLAFQGFCYSLIDVNSYRKREEILPADIIAIVAENEIQADMQWRRSFYLNDAYVATYAGAFLVLFSMCLLVFYKQQWQGKNA